MRRGDGCFQTRAQSGNARSFCNTIFKKKKKRTVVGRQGQQGLFCWPKNTPHKYDGEVIPYRLFSLCHVISFLSDHSASLCCHAQSNLTKVFRIKIADSCLLEIK